ncbi:MAG: hypothetical protein C4K60_00100 [Ideonella sp. MAG2]|nr:MAG: hypothetical protein C4K60_00100 [Ideonella sp. MAG2]
MKQTTTCTATLLALFISAAAGAAPGSAPLQLSGPGPYYRVTLPAALYPLAQDAELSDLRVRSAQGMPLPWAWADATGEAPPAVQRHTVPLFPLAAAPAPQAGDAALLLLQVRPDGTLAWRKPSASPTSGREWVIDTHAARGNLLSLALTLDPQAQGLFSLSLEHSDDLRTWHMAHCPPQRPCPALRPGPAALAKPQRLPHLPKAKKAPLGSGPRWWAVCCCWGAWRTAC